MGLFWPSPVLLGFVELSSIMADFSHYCRNSSMLVYV